jgi:hypothetical protein
MFPSPPDHRLTGGYNSLFVGECRRGVLFRKEVAVGASLK